MSRIGNLKKHSKYIFLILILGTFISSFYIVSYIYTSNNKNPKTVVLESNLFKNNLINDKVEELNIEKVLRVDTDYSIFTPYVLDTDSVIFQTIDNNSNKIYILDMNNNVTEAHINKDGYIGNINISEDGKKLIYSSYDPPKTIDYNIKSGTAKMYLYDFEEKKNTEIMNSSLYASLITKNNKFIGVNDDYLFSKDLKTGETKNLLNINDIISSEISKSKGRYNLISSKDENIIYFLVQSHKNSSEIYSKIFKVKVDNGDIWEDTMEGEIYKLIPLNDGNFIFSGEIKGNNGIFIYNVENKSYKNIKSGNIFNVELTEDNTKISYEIYNSNGISELHAATFKKDKIESDIIAYSNLKYSTSFKWSKDGNRLFLFTNSNRGTTIYRFFFKNEGA
jgi:Tol biopolymer transport system component